MKPEPPAISEFPAVESQITFPILGVVLSCDNPTITYSFNLSDAVIFTQFGNDYVARHAVAATCQSIWTPVWKAAMLGQEQKLPRTRSVRRLRVYVWSFGICLSAASLPLMNRY